MRKNTIFSACMVLMLVALFPFSALAQKTVVLTGSTLTLEDVEAVARGNAQISIDKAAMDRVVLSHKLLLQAAREGKNVYGLNTGVGINKDRVVFSGDVLAEDARLASEGFNGHLLHTHAVAVGPEASEDVVRAAMLVRLNTALCGYTAFHPDIVTMYMEFLNKGVSPVLPTQGTVGVADITILPYIGLVMMGEHEAMYKGRRMSGAEALKAAGLKPAKPYAKDGLSIVSSNAFSAGMACLTAIDAERLIDTANVVFALSLEGFNGNVSPFLDEVQRLRPFEPVTLTAGKIRAALKGGYLFQPHDKRAMQDPLSFRDTAMTHGAALDALNNLKKNLLIQINTQDDNPAVVVNGKLDDTSLAFLNKRYVLDQGEVKGLVLGTANFDPLIWVTDLERLGVSLSHMTRASAHRVLKLASDRFTNLPRNLAPDADNIGYLTIQKTVSVLDAENRMLSMPVSMDVLPLSGEIEDVGTNAGLVTDRVNSQIDNLYKIFAIETMHSSRAVGLRKKDAEIKLGAISSKLFTAVDAVVPAVGPDRTQGPDITAIAKLLRDFRP